ncbi:MAG TPA: prolipoprotein diacylglyceryl transferase [bacterium]|nr:prolipoprotein diacylglyceryl transferase [bacterium]
MYWLNTPLPATIISFGHFQFYWYGFLMALAMAIGSLILWRFSRKTTTSKDLLDLIFNLVITGLISARLYHVLIHWSDYASSPLSALKVWEGGLAIHGGLIGGLLALYFTCRQKHWSFSQWTAWLTPAVAIGQAIGRWGNFFNQELFGQPSTKPWAIPIDLAYRPLDQITTTHFQPLFLYESLGCLFLAIILYIFNRRQLKTSLIFGTYLIGYGLIRLIMEFFRQDYTWQIANYRWPQLLSLGLVFIGSFLILKRPSRQTLAK